MASKQALLLRCLNLAKQKAEGVRVPVPVAARSALAVVGPDAEHLTESTSVWAPLMHLNLVSVFVDAARTRAETAHAIEEQMQRALRERLHNNALPRRALLAAATERGDLVNMLGAASANGLATMTCVDHAAQAFNVETWSAFRMIALSWYNALALGDTNQELERHVRGEHGLPPLLDAITIVRT